MISEERLRAIALESGFGSMYPDALRLARAVEREAYEAALRALPERGVGHYIYERALTDCHAAIRALKDEP